MINTEEMVVQTTPEAAPSPFKLGTVAALFENNTAQVLFDGETTASEKQYAYLSTYVPEVDDRVLLVNVGGTYIIMGDISYNVAPSPPVIPQNYLFDDEEVVMTQGLDVTGLLEAKSGVAVTGDITATGILTGDSLSVGAATLTGNLSAVDVTASGKLGVTGTSKLTGTVTMSGNASVGGTLTVRDISTGSGYSSVFNGGITVANNVNFSSGGTFTCSKFLDLNNNLDVYGTTLLGSSVEIDGDLNHDGSKIGFFGTTPQARPTGTSYSTLSTSATLAQVIDKLNLYINLLKLYGLSY